MAHNTFDTLQSYPLASGKTASFYSLPALARRFPNINRLPVSIRIVLESVLRNCDGKKVTETHIEQLANWAPNASYVAARSPCRSRLPRCWWRPLPKLPPIPANRPPTPATPMARPTGMPARPLRRLPWLRPWPCRSPTPSRWRPWPA